MEAKPCKIFYCYKATNQVNGKVYIGFSADPQGRWRRHKYDANNGHGYAFHRAIRKHGWENFVFEVLCCGKNKQEMAMHVEPQLIEQYQSLITQNGYNLYREFRGSKKCSSETKRKLSERQMGKSCSEESRRKMSEAAKGRIMRPETRQKLREANLGKKYSKAVRRRMITAAKKRGITAETLRKFEEHRQTKRCNQIREAVLERLAAGELQKNVAAEFDVDPSTISRIWRPRKR